MTVISTWAFTATDRRGNGNPEPSRLDLLLAQIVIRSEAVGCAGDSMEAQMGLIDNSYGR